MKRLSVILLAILLVFQIGFAMAEPVRLMGLNGPTTIGMLELLQRADKKETANEYSFESVGTPDEVVAKLTSGQVDIAAIPANLASVLFNKTQGKIKTIDINTLGVLYIVEKGDSIKSVQDLKGKEILASGKGATPEQVLRYVLSKNGIDPDKDVTLTFKSEPPEIVAAFKGGNASIAMLPQPFATAAALQVEGMRTALDMTKEWNAVNQETLVTGVTVVRSEFLESNPEAVKNFLADHKQSVEKVNADVETYAAEAEARLGIKAAIAAKAIPHCNIVYIDGAEMQKALSAYLQVLYETNPQSVGGKLPTEDFYAAFE